MAAMMLMIAAVPMMSMAEKKTVSAKKATASNYSSMEYEVNATSGDYIENTASGAGAAAVNQETVLFGAAVAAKDIYGVWTVDGVTDLEFSEDGSGALIVPEHEFPFQWELVGDSLSLSFEDSAVRDVVYTVSKQGAKITIDEEGMKFTLKRP